MLTIVTALPREAGGLTRRMETRRWAPLADGSMREGVRARQAIRLVVSGPGRERVQRAAAALFEMSPAPSVLVATGLAGGLRPELRAGTLVLCERLLLDGTKPETEAHCATEAALSWGEEALNGGRSGGLGALVGAVRAIGRRPAPHWVRGSSLTVQRALTTPEAKAAAGERSGAAVVQMEDWHWAAAAEAAGVPFLAVRAVLDPASGTLPEAVLAWSSWERPRVGEVLRTVRREPRIVAPLARLAWQWRAAAGAIDRFLEALLRTERSPA